MKNTALKSNNKLEKVSEKVFTERKDNSTIKKKRNPLETNKNRKRRDGLYEK